MSVLLDTNILLHGKPIQELPFRELGESKVRVIVLLAVLEEIHAKKNQATNLARKAKRATQNVKDFLEGRLSHEYISELVTEDTSSVDWEKYPNLNKNVTDHHLLAFSSGCLEIGIETCIVTNDYPLSLRAKALDLNFRYVTEEPWAVTTQMTDSERRLSEIERAAPQLSVKIVDPLSEDEIVKPVLYESVDPQLTIEERKALEEEAKQALAPYLGGINEIMAEHMHGVLSRAQFRSRCDDYPKEVRRYYQELGILLHLMNALRFKVRISNVGRKPAEGMEIDLTCTHGKFNSQDSLRELISDLSSREFPSPPRRDESPARVGDNFLNIGLWDNPALENLVEAAAIRTIDPTEHYSPSERHFNRYSCDAGNLKHQVAWEKEFYWLPQDGDDGVCQYELEVKCDNIMQHSQVRIAIKHASVSRLPQCFDRLRGLFEDEQLLKTRQFWESAMDYL